MARITRRSSVARIGNGTRTDQPNKSAPTAERRAAENRAAETRVRAAADRLPPGQYLERLPTDDAATSDAKAKINDERAHAEMDRREREAKTDKMNAEFCSARTMRVLQGPGRFQSPRDSWDEPDLTVANVTLIPPALIGRIQKL